MTAQSRDPQVPHIGHVSNKILVTIHIEPDYDPDKTDLADFEFYWIPINFHIYSNLFYDMVDESLHELVSASNDLTPGHGYELIMQHEIEWNGPGVISAEYFTLIHSERVKDA